jgi:ParB family chromosome partitioning protein
MRALEARFREALGTKVNLVRSGDGGRIVIYFYSEEELDALYERFIGGE